MRTFPTALATLTITAAALAAEPVTNPAPPPWSAAVTTTGSYVFDADFGDASVTVLRADTLLTLGGPLSRSTFFKFSADGEYSAYDFDHLSTFGFADDDGPDDLFSIDLRPSVATYLNPNLSLYGGLIFGAAGEPSADVSDALYYGGFAGFSYQVRPGLWIGTGVGVSTQLEDDPFIVPLISLDWTITDHLSLEASGTHGLLRYRIDDKWSTFVEARYEFRQYRLDDDSVVPGGVLTDESLPVGVGVTYSASDRFNITLSGGAVLWRSIQLSNDDTDLVDEDADITPYLALSAKFVF